MLTEPGGPFIDISKLNLTKYAQRPPLAKVRDEAVKDGYKNGEEGEKERKRERGEGGGRGREGRGGGRGRERREERMLHISFLAPLQALFEYLFHHENNVRAVSTYTTYHISHV